MEWLESTNDCCLLCVSMLLACADRSLVSLGGGECSFAVLFAGAFTMAVLFDRTWWILLCGSVPRHTFLTALHII